MAGVPLLPISSHWVVLFVTLGLGNFPAIAASCESLTSLPLSSAAVVLAEPVAAGGFTPGGGSGIAGEPMRDLPAFCRVAAKLRPSSDSEINVEVWLPAAWNGKYLAVGNGGWAGSINYTAMAEGLRRGFATSSTDTGHASDVTNASFALGHLEKLIDYAYRSEHEMTLKAKAIIQTFYGEAPKYSYWSGCSGGGKQALEEAQRFPTDYDGIIAGAPANRMVHLHAGWIRLSQVVHKSEDSYIPPQKYALIHQAVLAACDALDGVVDGLIENPKRCNFDPQLLACPSGDGPSCLSAAQVEAAQQIYAPALNPRTRKEILPGLERGSELDWGTLAGPLRDGLPVTRESAVAVNMFRYVIFKDPSWDFRTLILDRDLSVAEKMDHGLNEASNPNLKPFFAHNGKMLLYHGWSDQVVPPKNSINYYESVVKSVGEAKAADSIRLFLAPGMSHCGGGAGPNQLDTISAIEQWVENGKAPDQLVASHTTDGKVDRTRPLCPYPQFARYQGSGSSDEASSFACVQNPTQ